MRAYFLAQYKHFSILKFFHAFHAFKFQYANEDDKSNKNTTALCIKITFQLSIGSQCKESSIPLNVYSFPSYYMVLQHCRLHNMRILLIRTHLTLHSLVVQCKKLYYLPSEAVIMQFMDIVFNVQCLLHYYLAMQYWCYY